MKRNLVLGILSLLTLVLATPSHAAFVSDNYYGGTYVPPGGSSYGDVIGAPDFSISGADVAWVGNIVTVKISGTYFLRNGLAATYGPGDLFLSPVWNTLSGSAADHYANDVFSLTEGWEYAVTSTGVYVVSANSDWSKTNAPDGYVYRTDQAWQYTGSTAAPINGAFISYSLTSSYVQYSFDISKLTDIGNQFGMHWTMKCGNDVFEGQNPIGNQVPEPGTMILFALGLAGVAGLRRKK